MFEMAMTDVGRYEKYKRRSESERLFCTRTFD